MSKHRRQAQANGSGSASGAAVVERALREELAIQRANLELLAETLAGAGPMAGLYDLAQESIGWQALGADSTGYLTDAELRRARQLSRYAYLRDPLINRAVNIQSSYVFGQGISVKARDEAVDQIVQAFWADPANQAELTSHQARLQKEIDLQVLGELFFVFFTDPAGAVKVRTINPDEIQEIICNPEDSKDPWWYKRVWSQRDVNGQSTQRTAYYPDWGKPADKGAPSDVIVLDYPIYHVKVGGLGDMRRGVPETYQAIPWAKAYTQFLEDRATVARSLATFAWKGTVAGGPKGLAAAKALFGSTLGSTSGETNPAPTKGSIALAGTGNNLDPVRTSGATINPDEGRRIALMAFAAMGLPECYAEDTEVLTDQGFLSHPAAWECGAKVACYNPDSGLVEWYQPNDLRSYYHNGEMVHFKSGQVDILVTPNHRMWTAPNVQWKLAVPTGSRVYSVDERSGSRRVADGFPAKVDRSWRIETAEHVLTNPRDAGWRFTSALRWVEPETEAEVDTPLGWRDAVAWARFIGYWVAEGCATASVCKSGEYRVDGSARMRTFRRVMLSQHEGPVLESMRATLRSLGLRFTEVTATGGVKNLVVYNKGLWLWLREHCGESSLSRRVPTALLYGGAAVRHALYTTLMEGDGGRSGGSWCYSSASRDLADQMQVLANSLGYGSSVSTDHRLYNGTPHPIHKVYIRTRITNHTTVRPRHIKAVPYSGMVHCFNVPHGIYVTRRNGKIAIQGNTFFSDASVGSLATAQSLDRPTELKFQDRRTLWVDVLQAMLAFVLDRAGVSETADRHIDLGMPSLLEHDPEKRIDSIIAAATLNGQTWADTLDFETFARLVLGALEVDGVGDLLPKMVDAFQAAQDKAAADAQAAKDRAAQPPPTVLPAARTPQVPTVEALMIRAVEGLQEALSRVDAG